MCPQLPLWLSTNRTRAVFPRYCSTFQDFVSMYSLHAPIAWATTFPSIKSSARCWSIVHPPPILKVSLEPQMIKGGDVIVPFGQSPCPPPYWWEGLGRFSKLPIHHVPWRLDGLFLLAELSPYVGWLLNAVPVSVHPAFPPSSKSKITLRLKSVKQWWIL